MKGYGLRLHGFHEFLDWLNIVIGRVFAGPRISAPQIRIGRYNVIKSTSELIVVGWIAHHSGQIVLRSSQIWFWHILRIGNKFRHWPIPAGLRDGRIGPESITCRVRIEAAGLQSITWKEVCRVRHVN